MPDRRELQVMQLLKDNGAVLVRHRKHQVYRFPDGRTFVFGTSPSDADSWKHCLSNLKRLLRRGAGVAREMGAA
jgi:hypothetical protein